MATVPVLMATGILGGGVAQMSARIAALPNNVCYWGMGDPSGTAAVDSSGNAANGLYSGTYTLAQPGIGDGSLSTSFDGVSGRVSIATPIAAIDTLMGDKSKGSIGAWGKVSGAGVWADATSRFLMEIGAGANNRVFIYKNSSSNLLTATHVAGGTTKQMTYSTSTVEFFSLWLTWDKDVDQAKMYVGGIQRGATLTGLGTWVGTLTGGFSALASFASTGGGYWSGGLAHGVLANVAYTAAQIASVSTL